MAHELDPNMDLTRGAKRRFAAGLAVSAIMLVVFFLLIADYMNEVY